MFRFVKANAGTSASPPAATDDSVSYDSYEDISAPTYRAIYVGNHMNASSREDECKRVDSLVTWAATNQVLFTWGNIRDDLAMGPFPELSHSSNKRRGGKVTGRSSGKSAKRSTDDIPGRPLGDDNDEESCAAPEWMSVYNKPLSSRITPIASHLPNAALMALQSFTIRLLSAMHRPILTVLYTSKPDSFLVPDDDKSPSQQFLSRLVGQNLPGKIKEEMLKSRSTSDRTLARIDRRLATGKYIPDVGDDVREKHGIHYHFYDLVRFVLKSLRHSLDGDDKASRAAVTDAIEDWARIRDRYLNSDDSKNWWSLSGWLSMSPSAIQSALLAPWAESEKCHVCKEDVSSMTESDDVLVCSCCATSIVHEKCHPNESEKSRPLSSMLRSYAPLQQVYSLRSPAGILPIPDYTMPHLCNTIKWSRHTIILNRSIVPGERPPSWGLGINHLETASVALDKVLEQTFDVTRLSSTDTFVVGKELGSPIPVRLPCPPELAGEGNKDGWRAILIGTVMPNMIAEKAGVRVGDIIVAMDLNPTTGDDVTTSPEATKEKDRYDLSRQTTKSRVELFRKQDVSSLRLHIYRPENIDFAKQGREFLDKSIQLSLAVMGLHKSNKGKAALAKQRWSCSACRSSPTTSSIPAGGDEGETSQSIHSKAFCCRSVVRRLAVEWYARPFVDEVHCQGDSTCSEPSKGQAHDCYVSLRRLDGMFSSIMEKHEDKPAGTLAIDVKSEAEEISPFFYAPPSSSSRAGRKRLEWAPVELEIDPFRLLCKGMDLLLSSTPKLEESGSDNSLILERKAKLAHHFLPLFSSYCLDSSIGWGVAQGDSNNNTVVRGPPNTIIAHCPPFLRQPCSCCGVRPTKDSTEVVGFCSESCRSAFKQGWLIDTSAGDKTSNTARSAEERNVQSLSKEEEKRQAYEINSSLVGSTILVLPDDPLFDKVCRTIMISHEDCGRPLEIIIASYLPFDFVGVEGLHEHGVYGDPGFAKEQQRKVPNGNGCIGKGGNANNVPSDKKSFITRPDVVDGGIFQLIPVFNSKQLTYVESKCGLRKPSQKSNGTKKSSKRATKEQWTDVEVLQLHGIVHLSVSEMRYRLDKTISLCSAIDSAVAHLASTYGGQSIEERAKENLKLLDTKDVNPLGSVGLVEESLEKISMRQLLEQFSSQGSASAALANAIYSLGHHLQSNLLSSHQAHRLEESSVLADTMIYRGVDIIRDTLSRGGDDGFDTDIDEDDASHFCSISQKHSAISTHQEGAQEGAQQTATSGGSCALASPKASGGGHLLLLEPTRFEGSSDYAVCYSDLVLFKGDVRKMGSLGKSVSLARRLELEKEKMGQLESTAPGFLTIIPPSFCRVPEKKLMEIPKRKTVEFGVCPEINQKGGRFDVILHRSSADDKAGANGENSDDEEWNPDKDGVDEGANASAGASGRSLNEFKGRGWGFELVRWRMDLGRVLRVGRVHPASPASRAGLLPNDIILCINGKAASTLNTEASLARELIATSYDKIDRPSGDHYIVDLLSKHKTLCGPIALQALRVVPGIRRTPSQSRSLTPSHSHGSLNPPPHGDERLANGDLRRLDREIARVDNEGARGLLQQERHLTQQQLAQQRVQEQQAAALAEQRRAIQQQQQQEQQRERQRQRQRSPAPPERPALTIPDLYKQGGANSILTRAETSVLVEAVERRLPKLGVRLLVPRYPRHVVLNECRITIPSVVHDIRNNLRPWPKISEPIWKRLAEADYERSRKETGDIVDQEPDPSNPSNSYQYTQPVEVLPIDRLLETFLKAQHLEREQQEEALRRQQQQQASRQQQQREARQEALRRRQEEERERARQEAMNAEHALAAIEEQRRQLDQQAAESRRVLARAQASVGVGHQPPVASPLQPHPNAFAIPQHQQQHQQQLPMPVPVPVGGLPGNNLLGGQENFVDLTDEGQGNGDSSGGINTDELQRIRGGGDGGDGEGNENGGTLINGENGANESAKRSVTPADGYPLPRIARSDWKGFVVIGKCHTRAILENGQSSVDTTYFLGILIADASSSPPLHGQETISVVVFYLAKKNIFLPVDGTIETKIEPYELFAAYEGSIAEQIYDEWIQRIGQDVGVKFYPAPGSSNEEIGHGQSEPVSVRMDVYDQRMDNGGGDERGSSANNGGNTNDSAGTGDDDDDIQIVETSPTPQQTISLRTAANLLVKRLSCRSASLLGYLPDGRAVVWLKSDPEAIYLRSPGSSDSLPMLTDDINQLQYVGIDKSVSNDEGSILLMETGSRLSCVWGCCSNDVSPTESSSTNNENGAGEQIAKDKHLLSYDTQEELTSHLNDYHGYVDTATCDLKPCARVSKGEAIIRLCADLSLAFCARCPGLIDTTMPLSLSVEAGPGAAPVPAPQHIIFDFQRNLSLTRSGKGSLNLASIATPTRECPEVRDMLRLVSRLCRLFAIERRGEYRLSLPEVAADEEPPIAVGDNSDTGRSMSFDAGEVALLSSIERDIEASQLSNSAQSESPIKKLPLSRCGVKCLCTSIDHSNDHTTTSDRATCSVCSGDGEGVIDVRTTSSSSEAQGIEAREIPDENSEPSTVPSGIGCALLSDFPDHKPPSRRKMMRDAKIMAQIKAVRNEGKSGQLKTLKVMLLTIAQRVPPSLYADNTTAGKPKPSATGDGDNAATASVSLWQDDNFHRWCDFVKHAGNERTLALAYLLLVNSVNKNRMPNWWTAKKSGWSSPMTSLHFQTLSSLALNFYVFDAAALDGSSSVSDGVLLRGSNSGNNQGPSGTEGDSPDKRPPKKTKKGGSGRSGDTNQYFEKLKKMNIATRMKTALKWADKCGIQRLPPNEDHFDVCTVCKEGGDLLCCELCLQSQHAECLIIRGGAQGINFDEIDFICEQCQLDTTCLMES